MAERLMAMIPLSKSQLNILSGIKNFLSLVNTKRIAKGIIYSD